MAIKQGTKPTKVSHKDYSHRSFGAIRVPFPPEYNTDAGLDMPDQNAQGLEFGCTDETQSQLTNDLVQKEDTNPWQLEAITHANRLGGYDVRDALTWCLPPDPLHPKRLGWITGFFNIEAIGQDMFDAVRTAMVSGATEKRSVSVGTKWFPVFENVDTTGILQMPNFSDSNYTWHNWKICGWKTINDQVYLIGKSWQGPQYGDKGYCYFSRPLFNQLMAVKGSVAFTATKGVLPPISTISVTWLQWLLSWGRNLLPY